METGKEGFLYLQRCWQWQMQVKNIQQIRIWSNSTDYVLCLKHINLGWLNIHRNSVFITNLLTFFVVVNNWNSRLLALLCEIFKWLNCLNATNWLPRSFTILKDSFFPWRVHLHGLAAGFIVFFFFWGGVGGGVSRSSFYWWKLIPKKELYNSSRSKVWCEVQMCVWTSHACLKNLGSQALAMKCWFWAKPKIAWF